MNKYYIKKGMKTSKTESKSGNIDKQGTEKEGKNRHFKEGQVEKSDAGQKTSNGGSVLQEQQSTPSTQIHDRYQAGTSEDNGNLV